MEITTDNFDEVIANTEFIFVDCFTEWCGPCKMLKPLLETIAKENDGVTIGYVDVENHPKLAQKLKVMSVPKVVAFAKGVQVAELIGVRNISEYLEVVEKSKGENK